MGKIIKYITITLIGIAGIFGLVGALCFLPVLKKIEVLKNEAYAIVASGSELDFTQIRTSIVYDCNNEPLYTYSGERDLYYVTIDKVPQALKDAFVVMEDKEFYNHNGVDYKAILRATITNYQQGGVVSGASTITQQLARNIYLTQDVNWDRKIKEAYMAVALEEKYDKEKILEYYLNNIYFGNGYYGVEAASNGYLGKSVSDLTTGECVFLAAIPNNPSRYDPVTREEDTVERAKRILKTMLDNGKIDTIEYLVIDQQKANPFVMDFNPKVGRKELNNNSAQAYIYTYVTYCATRYLMELHNFPFRYDFANEADEEAYKESYEATYNYYQTTLFTGGYRIYTSIDLKAQKMLQDTVDRVIKENDPLYDGSNSQVVEGYNPLQASAVTIDNDTGKVIAIVGGRTEDVMGYGYNRAYQSFRQPGSAIKPLNVYGPYINLGHSTEEPVYDEYNPMGPRNAGNAYAGQMLLKDALKYSKNTIAWQIYRFLTPESATQYLTRMEFKKVWQDKHYTSGALGGFSYGVSAEEMAAGFRTFANNGVYNRPTCIVSMYEDKKEPSQYLAADAHVYSENTASLMNEMLKGVIESGTGTKAKLTSHEAAGKTGTTNSNKDMWFVGYTAYYTTSVWVGYDRLKEVDDANGNLAVTIWHDYMDELHIGLKVIDFTGGSDTYPIENTKLENNKSKTDKTESTNWSNLWDCDMDAVIIGQGDQPAQITGGDAPAGISGGDEPAAISGGDAPAQVTGGDSPATITGGDQPAQVTGGDSPATITGGDQPAQVGGGDSPATITGGDQPAQVTGGDSPATITGGDQPAQVGGGDSPATITGGD